MFNTRPGQASDPVFWRLEGRVSNLIKVGNPIDILFCILAGNKYLRL
jgi:hypothetical protein